MNSFLKLYSDTTAFITFSISKQNLMRVTHQACRYTHLARKSMQNTGKSQGETNIHFTFYAELFESNALVVTYSTDVSGLPLIWLVKSRKCLHLHFT